MFGFVGLLKGDPPRKASGALPAELVQEIETAAIVFQASRLADDPESASQPIVWLANSGRWRWSGTKDAMARVHRRWPSLSEAQCQRAARLISRQISRQLENVLPRRRGQTYAEMNEEMERQYRGGWT